jgi:hypothetical protein
MSDPILSANLLVNRSPAKVKTAARRHLADRPLVGAFQEAGGYVPQLRALAKALGYDTPIVARKRAGHGLNSNVLMIRADVPVYAQGVAKVRVPWVGPRLRIQWPGRAFPWADIDLDDRRILVVNVHMPTEGRGINRLAWIACKRRLRKLVHNQHTQDRGFVLVGDWNNRRDDHGPQSIQRFADSLDAHVVRGGSPIDYAVVSRGLDLRGVRGPARGSDHPSTTYRINGAATA